MSTFSLKQMLQDVERTLITEALEVCRYNTAEAALLLGIGRTSLVERRRRLGMPLGSVGRNTAEERDRAREKLRREAEARIMKAQAELRAMRARLGV